MLSRHLSLNAILTALLAVLLLGCGAAPASALPPLSGHGGLSRSHPTGTVPLPPPVVAGFTYDTSVGNGIAADGLANLPLRVGAHRYYVNSSTGNDANSCATAQTAATPKATVTSGVTCVTSGAGDQVLVALGTTYSAALPNMTGFDGFSPTYPTVIESYDPADPTNEAKMGRASANRPTFTATTAFIGLAGGAGAAPKYLAWRGLDIVPSDTTDKEIYFVTNSTGLLDYVLIENCIFRHIQVTMNMAGQVDANGFAAVTPHFIFRGNTLTGMWSATDTIQAIYLSTVNYVLEDNVVYHAGWKQSANRDDLQSAGGLNGGATTQDHSIYAQYSSSGISRRNFIVDGSTDGGSLRGNNIFTANVGLDNPIQEAHGGGHDYFVERPDGVMLESSYNVFLGDADIYSGSLRGFGYYSSNGKPGSANHHNLIAQARNPAINYFALSTTIDEPTDSWMNHYRNVIWNWNVGGSNTNRSEPVNAGPPGTVHATYSNNIWDDATSGTNTNKGSVSVPNAYTNDLLIQAMGYTTGANYAARKLAMMTYFVEHPEAHPARTALPLAQAGYNITPLLQDLVAVVNVARGQPDRGPLVGTLDGSVLTTSGLPSGLTLNNDTRQWLWDGTGSGATSGTFSVTETPPTGPPHTSSIAYSINVPATLTSPSATSTGTTTATLGVTTDTGSGSLYWILTTAAASPSAVEVNAGYYDANNAAAKAGSVAVASTGAKTINVTGLTNATGYNGYLIQNVSGTRSLVKSLGAFTTGAGGGGGSTWASGSSSADWVLSGSNLIGTRSSGSGDALLRDATAATGRCFEITVNAVGTGNVLIGLTDSSAVTADYVHNHGISYRSDLGFVNYENGFQFTGSSFGATDKVGVCISSTNKVYFAKNATWQNSANPSAGTGGIDVTATVGSGMNPAASTSGTGAQVTLNTAGPFSFTLPTGFAVWN